MKNLLLLFVLTPFLFTSCVTQNYVKKQIGFSEARTKKSIDSTANLLRREMLALEKLPVGTIVPYAGDNIPEGWFLCDGTQLVKTNYNTLYLAIGTNWGSIDTNLFALPDLQGYFLRGADPTGKADPDYSIRTRKTGSPLTSKSGTYQSDEFKEHSHNYREPRRGGNGSDTDNDEEYNWVIRQTSKAGGNETRPKNAAVNFIIKYK